MKQDSLLPISFSYSDHMNVEQYYTEENFTKLVEYFLDPTGNTGTEKRDNMPKDLAEILANLRAKSTEFIQHLVGVLGQIKPVMLTSSIIDVDKTLHPNNFSKIMYKDVLVDPKYIISIFKFIRTLNWSDYNDVTQIRSPLYNSGVPLLLYAQRLYNSIPYSYWMDANPNMYATMLGKPFSGMPDARKPVQQFPITDLRVKMLTGKKTINGVKQPFIWAFTTHKANKTGDTTFDSLPEIYRMMLAQLWIYNIECRNPAMILDWHNWDNIPESYDSIQTTGEQGAFRIKKIVQHGTVY